MTHTERLKKISKEYLEIICPYLLQYEMLTQEFPVAVLNEIRSAFTHIAKYYVTESDKEKEKSIKKTEDHFKRILRDCYKYVCSAYDDEYLRFGETYKGIDLSLINDGDFLPKLEETRKKAVEKLSIARTRELDTGIKEIDETKFENELLKLYQDAYIEYANLYEIIAEAQVHAEKLRKKTIEKEKKAKKKEKIYEVLTWVFGIATLVGVALTIVGFTL